MKVGDKVYCKEKYFYNGFWCVGDKFEVIALSEYNVRLRTKIGTYQNIRYNENGFNRDSFKSPSLRLLYREIFYSTQEYRRLKLEKIRNASLIVTE